MGLSQGQIPFGWLVVLPPRAAALGPQHPQAKLTKNLHMLNFITIQANLKFFDRDLALPFEQVISHSMQLWANLSIEHHLSPNQHHRYRSQQNPDTLLKATADLMG